MNEKLILIPEVRRQPGCNFSQSPIADTWRINIRITESEKYPFVYCNRCSRPTCYRYQNMR